MKILTFFSIVTLFSTVFVPFTNAQTTSASMNLNPTADSFVRKSYPNNNYGNSAEIYIEAGSSEKRGLLRFNLQTLPAGTTINRVILRMYVTNNSVKGGTLYEAASGWVENAVAWNNAPAVGNKIIDIPRASSTGTWGQVEIPINFIKDKTEVNWYIISTTEDAVYYNSRNSSRPPQLTIEYSSESQTPTPTTITPTSAPTDIPATTPIPTVPVTPTTLPTVQPTVSFTPTPTATPTPPPQQGVQKVIIAAGDVGCDPAGSSFNGGNGSSSSCRMKYTAALVNSINPDKVLSIGDAQHYCGSLEAYNKSYDLSWGAFKNNTFPVPGNHDYLTSGGSGTTGCSSADANANGYFTYFGNQAGEPGKGYQSQTVGDWLIVGLNTNCSKAGGCSSGSAQYKWLESQLIKNPNKCVLAFFHIPLFSSGGRANSNSKPFWDLLYKYNAEIILNGHDHIYERFYPQLPSGTRDDSQGIRQFTVGTGGANHTSLASTAKNSALRNADTFGVLKLTLKKGSYDWQFVPEAGKSFTDSGTGICR